MLFQNVIFPCKTVNCHEQVTDDDAQVMKLQTLKWQEDGKGTPMETSYFVIENTESHAVVLFAHTNSEKLTKDLWQKLMTLAALGLTVVAFDYPGYGFSNGTASEHSVYQSIVAVFRHVTWTTKLAPDAKVLLVGQSLGTAAVTFLAERCPDVMGVVLISPFKSITQIVTGVSIPGLDGFRNDKRIPKLAVPVLIIHGEEDGLVPIQHAKALHEACKFASEPLWLEMRDHHDVLMDDSVFPRIFSFAQECEAAQLAMQQASQLPPAGFRNADMQELPIIPTIDRAAQHRLSVDYASIPRASSAPPPRRLSVETMRSASPASAEPAPRDRKRSIFKNFFQN